MIERGTFDWRFWLTLSLALMVLYLAYLGMVGVEESHEKDARIDALIASTEAKDAAAQLERRAASRERRIIANNQDALLDYTRSLAERQVALLEYLHRHGIEIPARFTEPVKAPVLHDPSGSPTSKPPSGRGNNPPAGGTENLGGSRGHGSGGDGPGNSENAPGHNKPPKHHRPRGPKG